jgi:hypothetical protein
MNYRPKPRSKAISLANLCCLAGTGMLLYSAFLLHSAVGYAATGVLLIAFGVNQTRDDGADSRSS